MAKTKQLELVGLKGKRRGRPRKPGAVSHRARPSFESRLPQLVTVRLEKTTWNLRSRRSFRVVERAFWGAMALTNVRVCSFSIQGNHLHLLVEAADKRTLSRAMQSLDIRLAKNLNKMMVRSGRVVAHRYHCRILRTPTQVRNARRYVLQNYVGHARSWGEFLSPSFVDPYSSAVYVGLPQPETWLLSVGWQRARATSRDDAALTGGDENAR